MGKTYVVLAPDGQDWVKVVFSEPICREHLAIRFMSELNPESVPPEMYRAIQGLMDSHFIRELKWGPEQGLRMRLRPGRRRSWLINILPGILSDIAIEARQHQQNTPS